MTKSTFVLTATLMLLSTSFLNAQYSRLKPGKVTLHAGIGLLPTYLADHGTAEVLPLRVQVGVNLSKRFNLNAFAGYSHTNSAANLISDGISSYYVNKLTIAGLRGELHQEVSERFGVYGGVMLGYSYSDITEMDANQHLAIVRDANTPSPTDPNAPKGKAMYAGFVGGNYFFKKNIGVFAEVGYGLSLLSTGLTVRI